MISSSIERLCDIAATDPTVGYSPRPNPIDDRGPMIRAARTLLSSVTRVLLLADIVVVKQLLLAKDRVTTSGILEKMTSNTNSLFQTQQVARTLGRLESVANFTEFVKAFSVFGAEMVELAHVTGSSAGTMSKLHHTVKSVSPIVPPESKCTGSVCFRLFSCAQGHEPVPDPEVWSVE
uniref:Uncharacterized protein n=1 Tax=Anopheles culicifacies TaxID=139723 RepID=A0A182M2U1_9DIPT